MTDGAVISEIFSSIQGEGMLVGCRQIFIRFSGCNLQCRFCDTRQETPPTHCRCEAAPGTNKFDLLPNPLSVDQVVRRVERLEPSRHQAVSLTGGEPLLHVPFLKQLIPLLPATRRGIYLETNGTLPAELEQIIDFVDMVAMDIKLPGTAGAGPFWEEHHHFLALAVRKNVQVKIIVDDDSAEGEVERALDLIRRVGDIPVVFQPVTAPGGYPQLSPRRALFMQARAMAKLSDVRVIPQTHRFIQVP